MNEATPPTDNNIDPMLASAQVAITNLTSQVNRAYEDLMQRGEQLKHREQEVRDREARAAETLADAQRDSAEMMERAQHQEAETLRNAESEAERIVEHARSIENQIAQRLAELGRREQDLNERETQVGETAQRQQAERDWLNEYAQRLTGIATDLERALGDVREKHGVGAEE